jgi:aryl-phospho-beta-D-glucosidase BglC (GH1 family)
MSEQWNAKLVRLSLNQDFWLSGSAQYDSSYQCWVNQQVEWIRTAGMGVILDLHWSDCGNLQLSKSCQQPMADSNSVTFWTQVATQYKNQNDVLFELYNEPMQIAWNIWRDGGSLSSSGGCCSSGSFNAVGMQQLYDAVRATGANNFVVVGGINWAYDLSGVTSGYALNGSNIIYNTHPYDHNDGSKMPSDWPRAFGNLAKQKPVMATEFGQYCYDTDYDQEFIQFAASYNMSWTSWAWFVSGCEFPSIISDWNGTPLGDVGQLIQTSLKNQ